ncbi:MAG: hypothetical protein ACHQAX_07830 [Gammaproteobacteria bacterium]
MSEYELIEKAIWNAARRIKTPSLKTWMPLAEETRKEFETIVNKMLKLINDHGVFKKTIYTTAKTIIESDKNEDENTFDDKTKAIQDLNNQAERIVLIYDTQKILKKTLLEKLWNSALYLAAGRLIKAASLGVEHDPNDMAIVSEAKRRGPLLLAFANKMLLDSSEDLKIEYIEYIVNNAIQNVPAETPIPWVESRHPLDALDNVVTAYFKNQVGEKLWTMETLLSTGRITASRSLRTKPSWEDIEKTRKADKIGRLAISRLTSLVLNNPPDEELFISPEMITNTITTVENNPIQTLPLDTAIGDAIREKIKQYVWTSHPDFWLAKANYEKHGDYFTAHGDVQLMTHALKVECRLFEKVNQLLMAKDKERLDEKQHPIVSWLWGSKELQLFTPDVSNDLIDKAAKMLKYETRHIKPKTY